MRKIVALLTIAAAAAIAVPALSTGAAPRPCALKGSQLVAADGKYRIYTKQGKFDTVVYACTEPRKRRHVIARYDEEGGSLASYIRLEGRYVAYWYVFALKGNPSTQQITRIDLESGETIRGSKAEFVFDVDLSHTGTVAWLERGTGGEGYRVRALEPGGARELDTHPGIRTDSLAVSHDTVYWSRGDEPRAARVP